MRELNLLTKTLLEQGYSRENPPEVYEKWNDFYGGFQYSMKQKSELHIETPCGLISEAWRHCNNGYASINGVDWMLENDNALVTCPYRKKDCSLRDPRIGATAGYIHCATHIVRDAGGREMTLELAYREREQTIQRKIQAFIDQRGGRCCPHQIQYNESTDTVHTWYDPRRCATNQCAFCMLTGEQNDTEKGNVYYDLCIEHETGQDDLMGRSLTVTKTKGCKLFERPVSMSICKRTAHMKEFVEERVEHNCDIARNMFFAKYHGVPFRAWVENIRAERREVRDLIQDLEDIQNGIKVRHNSDEVKAASQSKRDSREKSRKKTMDTVARMIAEGNQDSLWQYRWKKLSDKYPEDMDALYRKHKARMAEQDKKEAQTEQMSFLD